jgi:hypothetical protein
MLPANGPPVARLRPTLVSPAPNVRNIDVNHCIATWDRVLIQVWRGEATTEAAQVLMKAGRLFLAEHPGVQCNSLSIVESRSPPPNDKIRQALSACYRDFAPRMKHQIFVAEGSGFRSALVRGVGLTVSTFAPSLLPFKFAASVDEAAMVIAPSLSTTAGGAEGLKGAVRSLRDKLDHQTPG